MLKQVTVDDSFWELFPDAQINILYADGIDNHDNDKGIEERRKMIAKANQEGQKFLTNETFRLNPVIDQWRQAYQQFKKKKGARSSIEALLKRTNQGRKLEPIDPMVDIYNCVSLTYGVPVGMEDRQNITDTMHLGQVSGGQSFLPVGADEDEPTLPGEVCWYDDQGAVCRCLNWRDGKRTMLTEDSSSVVGVIESVNDEQIARANEAIDELAQLIQKYFGVQAEVYHLTKDQPTATVSAD